MHSHVDTKAFKDALKTCAIAVDKSPVIPILEYVSITFVDTPSRTGVEVYTNARDRAVTYFVEAEVLETGSVLVEFAPFRKYIDTIKTDQLEMFYKDGLLRIKSGRFNSGFNTISSDEYLPPMQLGKSILTIHSHDLWDALRHVSETIAKNDNRPILQGICMDIGETETTFVTADGYHLAQDVQPTILKGNTRAGTRLIPSGEYMRKFLALFKSYDGDVNVYKNFNDSAIVFELGNVTIQVMELDGRYPDYTTIIPASWNVQFTVLRQDMDQNFKTAQVFAQDSANAVYIELSPLNDYIEVSGRSTERGDVICKTDAAISKGSEALNTAVNSFYMKNVLKVINDPRVIFETNGAEEPVVIRTEATEFPKFVIMPLAR